MDINEIRREIDRLDNELLRIFNQRAELALKIGEIKKELGLAGVRSVPRTENFRADAGGQPRPPRCWRHRSDVRARY